MQGKSFNLIFDSRPDQLSQMKVLMIGVGGIGCELLKVVSRMYFKEFHIIDMDTIEVSNLNRQFLFKSHHRGMAKSLVAKESMKQMAPQLNIYAHVAAVGQGDYRMNFIQQFDVVIMALDNQDTRSYVNKVCRAMGIYLLDAGSMGFYGQSTQYFGDPQFSCYDCLPRSNTQKQYPACTIRQQPTNCIHCVIWGKYLFQQLFGESIEDDSGILEFGGAQKDNASHIFNLFFKQEIVLLNKQNLQIIELPVDIDEWAPMSLIEVPQKPNLMQLIQMWFYSIHYLLQEKKKYEYLTYEKDEWFHTLFIYACTLLRCYNFKIEPFDFTKIKTICGNIIHAIASTNSMVASFEISKMLQSLYHPDQEPTGETYLNRGKRERISSIRQSKPNQRCMSCCDKQYQLIVEFDLIIMGQLVQEFRQNFFIDGIITFAEDARIIWDDEDDDQLIVMQKKLLSQLFDLNRDNRVMITINDQPQYIIWIINQSNINDIRFMPMRKHRSYFQLDHQNKQQIKRMQRTRPEEPIFNPKPKAQIVDLIESDEGCKDSKQVISLDSD